MKEHLVIGFLLLYLMTLSLAKPSLNEMSEGEPETGELVRGLPKEEADQVDHLMVEVKSKISELHGYQMSESAKKNPLFGDLAMTLEQATEFLKYLEVEEQELQTQKMTRRRKRNALNFSRFPYTRWGTRIKFSIKKEHFTPEQTEKIREAFKMWERVTCLRFIEVKENTKKKGQRLEIKGDEPGCWSYVGRTKIPVQPINLEPVGCTLLNGIMAHEIGHAIGLYHLEDRPDRENYLDILMENILENFHAELEPQPATSVDYYGVPFDYASIMQLRRDSYSKDGSYTLLPTDQTFLYTMGMLAEVSFLDATIVNRAYQCHINEDECPSGGGQLKCHENGYPDPGLDKQCATCRCPGGLAGRCNRPFRNSPGCLPGTSKLEVSSGGILESPDYSSGGPYKVGQSCSWILTAPEDHILTFEFSEPKKEFGVYHYNASGGICAHWVEINHHGNFTLPGKRHCGSKGWNYNQREKLQTTTNKALVYFNAESPELLDDDPLLRRGFRLCYDIKKKPKSKGKPRS